MLKKESFEHRNGKVTQRVNNFEWTNFVISNFEQRYRRPSLFADFIYAYSKNGLFICEFKIRCPK